MEIQLNKANIGPNGVTGNGTSKCPVTAAPSSSDYWRDITADDPAALSVTIICIFATILIVLLYCVKFYYIRIYVSSYRRASKMAWVAGIFPVTAAVSTIGICMPRTLQVVDIFIYLYFTRCLFSFVQLIADYFGGELEMAKFLRDDPIALNTLPCCCCCVFLPKKKPTKALLRKIGILVYQVAILPPLIFFVTAIVWVDQLSVIKNGSKFVSVLFPLLSVLQVVSILVASYGTQIFTRMAAVSLKDYCIKSQMRFVQMMVLLYNVQGDIFNIASSSFHLVPCTKYISSADRASLWNHYLLIFEILLMSMAAAWLLRPKVNATFDLHESQLATHSQQRKVGLYEEDYYIHADELAENDVNYENRGRNIKISNAMLETDVIKPSSYNPFAPKPRLSLYGPGPSINQLYPGSTQNGNTIGNNVPRISIIYTNDEKRRSSATPAQIISPGKLDPRSQLNSVSSSADRGLSISADRRRKSSLLEMQYTPRRLSQGPWLQRLPSPSSPEQRQPRVKVIVPERQIIPSISEVGEDDVFHMDDMDAEKPEVENVEPETGKPEVSVVEYLI